MAMFFPYFELAASLFILLLAFQIWTRHHENSSARFFSRLALLVFFATILEYSSRIAFTLDIARDIDRLSVVFWTFSFSAFAHFALNFAGKTKILKSRWLLPFLYLPPAIISSLFLFTNIMYVRFEIWSVGIVSQPSIWYSLFMVQTLFYSLLGLYVLYRLSRTAHQKTVSKQALLIAVGTAFPVSLGLVTDELLPIIFQARLLPPTAVFDSALMFFFIYLAMRNYSLFAISPALAAETIIETMPDSLIVTNIDGKILFLNEEAQKFFHASNGEVAGHFIAHLFKDKSKFAQLYDEVVGKRLVVERFQADLVDPLGEQIPALINARLLRQKLIGESLGIVFVVRDIRG